jgi:hypothetical protein
VVRNGQTSTTGDCDSDLRGGASITQANPKTRASSSASSGQVSPARKVSRLYEYGQVHVNRGRVIRERCVEFVVVSHVAGTTLAELGSGRGTEKVRGAYRKGTGSTGLDERTGKRPTENSTIIGAKDGLRTETATGGPVRSERVTRIQDQSGQDNAAMAENAPLVARNTFQFLVLVRNPTWQPPTGPVGTFLPGGVSILG